MEHGDRSPSFPGGVILGTLAAAMPSIWRYRVNARIGLASVYCDSER